MSAIYDAVRNRAVDVAKEELALGVTENNNYDAVKILANPNNIPLENRGERVDDYLRNAGVTVATMNSRNVPGHNYDDDRQWCGMFVYYCYSTALVRCGNNASLPFRGVDLWGGQNMRAWADGYRHILLRGKKSLAQQYGKDLEEEKQYRPALFDDANTVYRYRQEYDRIQVDKQSLVKEFTNMEDSFSFTVWDNASAFFSPADAARVQVKKGDIFAVKNGHIGMASGDSDAGNFDTIEGNQSDLAHANKPGWDSIRKLKKNVYDCSLIIRI